MKLMKMVVGAWPVLRSMCVGGCVALGAGVAQAESVAYRDYDASRGAFTNAVRECTILTSSATLITGWCAVTGTVAIAHERGLSVNGDVHLILCDGASLTVSSTAGGSAGIKVLQTQGLLYSLTIYGQEAGTGRLTATGDVGAAGIGGRESGDCGRVTVNGGRVTAVGGAGAAGIGGSAGRTVDAVIINGGAVKAVGGEGADDIGCGAQGTLNERILCGGVFATEPKAAWLAPGFKVVPNPCTSTYADYPYMVRPHYVASVITPTVVREPNKYGDDVNTVTGFVTNFCPTVAEALAAVRVGARIVLNADAYETLLIGDMGAVLIDLNGFTLSPGRDETDVIRHSGTCSNDLLSVSNGKLSGNLRFGISGAEPPSVGIVTLGPDLVSDGDIFAYGTMRVVLADGFHSTYTNGAFSSEIPLYALEGATFRFRHNLENAPLQDKLVFPNPCLELVQRGSEFVVAEPEVERAWTYALRNWMSDIPDETPFSKVCLPASHDTGMSGSMTKYGEYGRFMYECMFKTQDLGVRDQLNIGCRYFDLRFRVADNGEVRAFHAPSADSMLIGCMGESMDAIINAIKSFLSDPECNEEVVLLFLSHWGTSPKSSAVDTQRKVIDEFCGNLSDYIYRATGEGGDILNRVPIKHLRGKVVLLVDPAEGTTPISPRDGIWGFCKDKPKAGYYCMYDKYANMDDFDDMKSDQLAKWRDHGKNPEDQAFCLDWTLTMQPPFSNGVNVLSVLVVLTGVAAIALIIALLISAFSGAGIVTGFLCFLPGLTLIAGGVSAPLLIVAAIEYAALGHTVFSVRWLSDKANPHLADTLNEYVNERGYVKPSFVSLDFVDEKYTRKIVELNADLCQHAAEVVNADGSKCVKYVNLNDAFADGRLKKPNNGCTVRLLRKESPDDKRGYLVDSGCHVRFDLNGKWLSKGEKLGNNPLLYNHGKLEIVNSRPQKGGFEALGDNSADCNGTALLNTGEVTVRGVRFRNCRNKPGTGSVILNSGPKMVLDGVDISATDQSCTCDGVCQDPIYLQPDAPLSLFMSNCTISVRGGSACRGIDGTIEMFGGSLGSDSSGRSAVEADQGCQFTLHGGEIVRSLNPIRVGGSSRFVVREGFVGGGKSACFVEEGGGSVAVYSGCFGLDLDDKWIVDGTCDHTDRYPAYPFEVVPCDSERNITVARIVRTGETYSSVQLALDAVKDGPAGETIELLGNTHPVDTIVVSEGCSAILDLNGHQIVKRGKEASVFHNFGDLTITDSASDAPGVVQVFGTNEVNAVPGGGIVYNAGVFTLENGTLREGIAQEGGCIYNAPKSLCRLNGGAIFGCHAHGEYAEKGIGVGGGVFSRGSLILRGVRIENCTADIEGGGIWNGGDAWVSAGEIRGCSAVDAGGIANARDLSLFGGVIADNVASCGAGNGIRVNRYTQTFVCGARIKDDIVREADSSPGVKRTRSGGENATEKILISDGLFGVRPDPSWIDPGSVCTENDDPGTAFEYPTAIKPKAVASAGGVSYPTLQAAFDQTVGMTQEVEVRLLSHVRDADTVLPDDGRAVLDLAGYSILGRGEALGVSPRARLRIVDSAGSGEVNNFFAANGKGSCSVRNAGICRIEGGRYADPVVAGNSSKTTSVKAGLFSAEPDASWIDPSSRCEPNADEATGAAYPFAVIPWRNASFGDEPTNAESLQRLLRSAELGGDGLRTVQLAEDVVGACVTVPAGRHAVLDLRGRRMRGIARKPVITVEKGASLVIVDSVGGGLVTKEIVPLNDCEAQGGIANYGDLTLAGGTISNCFGWDYGGVYNAAGATFVMSGGVISGCGTFTESGQSAPGVLNAGTFWMSGGEIFGCESGSGCMGVMNLPSAHFFQLGGVIRDGIHNKELSWSDDVCYVGSFGEYLMVDGQITGDALADCSEREPGLWVGSGFGACVYYNLTASGSRFVQAWGEIDAKEGGHAVLGRGAPSDALNRVSNGKLGGGVSLLSDKGMWSGGFYCNTNVHAVSHVTTYEMPIPDFCTKQANTDAATRDVYLHRVVPDYEVEVRTDDGAVTRCMLQEGLDYKSSGGFTVRLLNDVKDCVVCTNVSPIVLDLNGFAITGTGKVFDDGFARPVIRNEGDLTIVDSSRPSSGFCGFIAMPSVGRAEMGGAICNRGALTVRDIDIFGCRARCGGGVYNAQGATAAFENVRIVGCRAEDADSGDLLANEGEVSLSSCMLEAWPDATDPLNVRTGSAVVNSGEMTVDACRVRGLIADSGEAGGLVISSGCFDRELETEWIDAGSRCWANDDEVLRLEYPWAVGAGVSVEVRAGTGVRELSCRFAEDDFEVVNVETGRTFENAPSNGTLTVRATYVEEDGRAYSVEKTARFNLAAEEGRESITVDRDFLFDAAIGQDLYPTVTDALRESAGKTVRLLHDVVGGGHFLSAGKQAVLDLNGKGIYGGCDMSVIVNEGDLTLMDSSENGSGLVTMTSDSEVRFLPDAGGGICNYGRFTLVSGRIEGCDAGICGGGIYGSDLSETYVRGGIIRDCTAEEGESIYTAGRVEISGGAIRESIEVWRQPRNQEESADEEQSGTAVLSGGVYGRRPTDESWLALGATVEANGDPATRESYPYRVASDMICDPIYDVVRVDQAYFAANSTVLEANRIYRFVENVTLVGSTTDRALASALSVTGGTTVIYIDAGVTVSLTGSEAAGCSGAGLRVPERATVVVAGEGTLLAKGSDSTSGQGGYDADGDASAPGDGGQGGTGAAAAIGGVGGIGGDGECHRLDSPAEAGQPGEGMGRVVLLGNVRVSARSCSTAAQGGERGKWNYGVHSNCVGGGGGGGSGGVPAYAIGGGAGGGGGGSSGAPDDDTAGAGGFGGRFDGNDGDGEDGGYDPGAGGACGGDGRLYAGDAVILELESISNRVAAAVDRHDALRRRMTIVTEDGVEVACLVAYVGEPLPKIGPNERTACGEMFGLYHVPAIGDALMWYNAAGTPVKDRYMTEDLGDVTLVIRPDDSVSVAILAAGTPDERRFVTLEDAVAAAKYGSTITIVGDVTGENVKIRSGTTILIGSGGKFRPPEAKDLLHDYYMVKTNFEGSAVVGYEYLLDASKVTPKVGDDSESGTPWLELVVDEKTGLVTSAIINIVNAYEDLYYGVDSGTSPTELNPPAVWLPAFERGSLRLEVPAAENGYFYRVRATDHVGGTLPDRSGYRLMTE